MKGSSIGYIWENAFYYCTVNWRLKNIKLKVVWCVDKRRLCRSNFIYRAKYLCPMPIFLFLDIYQICKEWSFFTIEFTSFIPAYCCIESIILHQMICHGTPQTKIRSISSLFVPVLLLSFNSLCNTKKIYWPFNIAIKLLLRFCRQVKTISGLWECFYWVQFRYIACSIIFWL